MRYFAQVRFSSGRLTRQADRIPDPDLDTNQDLGPMAVANQEPLCEQFQKEFIAKVSPIGYLASPTDTTDTYNITYHNITYELCIKC